MTTVDDKCNDAGKPTKKKQNEKRGPPGGEGSGKAKLKESGSGETL